MTLSDLKYSLLNANILLDHFQSYLYPHCIQKQLKNYRLTYKMA